MTSDTSAPSHDASTPAGGFEDAMARTSSLLTLWEREEISDEVLADQVGELVRSRDGARGFFVVAMAGETPLMDRLPDSLMDRLRQAGAGVIDLTVRNLAMSTAMAVEHRRRGDADRQEGSERVQQRSMELLRQLDPVGVKQRLEGMLAAARSGEGPDVSFLERWKYDADQRAEITACLESLTQASAQRRVQ